MIENYWYIGLQDGSGYKIDANTLRYVKNAMASMEYEKSVIEFVDIFGTDCAIVLKFVACWHHSTPEARRQHNEFQQAIEKEKEKPEWDQ